MNVRGEIVCLHCGHNNGTWSGEAGAPLTYRGCDPAREGMNPGGTVHCGRCNGSVFLDGASHRSTLERVRRIQRMRRQLAAWDDEAA